jgi:hypothetical protein
MFSKKNVWYSMILWVRILLSVHVWYQYVTYSSSQTPSNEKKGTFVEAITDEVWYLPYVSSSDADKFYQSLLFKNCSFPLLNEATIEYENNACVVTTQDYQTFVVQLSESAWTWSDGTPMNLNDILFTYQTLIADNYREIPDLEWLRGIEVTPDSINNQIIITFSQPNVDNSIFFTNFILPSHILANQTVATYIENFGTQPITSWCAKLQPSLTDPTSTVFDLENCEDTNLRYYQVKAFSELDDIKEYIPTWSLTIDMSTQPFEYEWYTQHKVLINKMQSFFFNTASETFTVDKRKIVGDLFTSLFATTDTQDYLIKDQYLFDQYSSLSLNNTWVLLWVREGLQATSQQLQTVSALTTEITWNDEWRSQTYQLLEAINDKFQILFTFEEWFERISVSHNWWPEYFPASFSSLNNTSFYNLNPLFNNITSGLNTYTIRAYRADGSTATYEMTVSYLEEYEVTQEVQSSNTFRVISFDDPVSQKLLNDLQQSLLVMWLSNYFVFETFEERNEYEGKLTSRDYDIALRTINLWLRKDISTLFTQDDPLINPSLRKDQEFADEMNRYFRVDTTEQSVIKSFLDERFAEQYPLVILWKAVETITLRSDITNPFPFRLYILWWRGQYLPNLEVFNHISINRDRIKSLENAQQFIAESIEWVYAPLQENTEQ